MSVTLLEVWRAARARSVPFSGESAGFAALALCEATEHSPRSLGLVDAELGDDGVLRLLSNRSCSEQQADQELRTLLGRLLEVSSSPGPSLFRVAGRGGGASLHALADEIEKALIPLNRAAARRALVRLQRETARAVEQGKLAPVPDLEEPAQIRLSPPPPAVARSEQPKPVAPPVREARLRESPPPLPVQSPLPMVVACVTPPPVAPVAVRPIQAEIARLPIALESREPTLPLELPLVAVPEVEHLTSPQTVVARRARGIPTPPPLPTSDTKSESTPRMGSVDVAVISVPATQLPPLQEASSDLTERVPSVIETATEHDFDAPAEDGDAELRALERWPVPKVAELAPESDAVSPPELPRFPLDLDLSPDLPTAEPPAVRESPALVVGVHVADSDDTAEPVRDDELDDLETRPLPSSVAQLPVEPIRHILAPESDVRELVSDFKVQGGLSETELRRELKALAGVDLTPGPAAGVGPR